MFFLGGGARDIVKIMALSDNNHLIGFCCPCFGPICLGCLFLRSSLVEEKIEKHVDLGSERVSLNWLAHQRL